MFHGYNWQTRILEVRPERLPPEYEQHAAPMQQGLPRQGSSPAGFHHQPPPQGGHAVASMFLNHSHMGQMNGLLANGGFRSTSPYNGGGLGVGGGGGGRSPHNSSGASPGLQHASPAATVGMLNAAGLGPLSASSPAFASPSLSAALLNHNQQQIVRSLTPKARSATPASSSSALGPSASEISALEQALATNLRLTAQSQSLAGTAPGARAPPPGSLGSLSPLPAFGQVGHALQPAYAQGRQQDSRTASRGPDNLAGRVLFVGNVSSAPALILRTWRVSRLTHQPLLSPAAVSRPMAGPQGPLPDGGQHPARERRPRRRRPQQRIWLGPVQHAGGRRGRGRSL